MGWSTLGELSTIMNSNVPLSLKRMVFNHYVLPVLKYGLEALCLTENIERKLRSIQRGMERKMPDTACRTKKLASLITDRQRLKILW